MREQAPPLNLLATSQLNTNITVHLLFVETINVLKPQWGGVEVNANMIQGKLVCLPELLPDQEKRTQTIMHASAW